MRFLRCAALAVAVCWTAAACDTADPVYLHNASAEPVEVFAETCSQAYRSPGRMIEANGSKSTAWNVHRRARYRATVCALNPDGELIFCREYVAERDRRGDGTWQVTITPGDVQCALPPPPSPVLPSSAQATDTGLAPVPTVPAHPTGCRALLRC